MCVRVKARQARDQGIANKTNDRERTCQIEGDQRGVLAEEAAQLAGAVVLHAVHRQVKLLEAAVIVQRADNAAHPQVGKAVVCVRREVRG